MTLQSPNKPVERGHPGWLVLCFLALGACGGEDDPPDPGAPAPDPGGSGTLGSYFVSSFDGFEARAAWLRDSVARYTIQSGNVTLPNHPQTPANENRTILSYPLASVRAEYAHAAGLTGAGEIVSVVDGSFRSTHQTFAGRLVEVTGTPPLTIDPDDPGHGTMVSSIAVGNSATMIGIAPGASLHFGHWDNATEATQRALALGAVAQNNSWGFVDPINTNQALYISVPNFNYIFGDTDGQAYLAALDAYAAYGVVVFALSNEATDPNAGLMDALPSLRPSLESGWLAVGNAVPVFDAVGVSSVSLFSAPCREAAAWCLLADGFWYAATSTSNTSYQSGTGSSFAAPQVAGALALLAEAFAGTSLTPHDLRIRLLASADNTFA